ncbi:hypothetical protein VNO77_27834 [Canavalia gladiata]|uniref:Uncharacterized protein n=1 Tax=Canavalia gladiata TaxID=3824 RepID=A0AAN9KVZ5_CANGL
MQECRPVPREVTTGLSKVTPADQLELIQKHESNWDRTTQVRQYATRQFRSSGQSPERSSKKMTMARERGDRKLELKHGFRKKKITNRQWAHRICTD